SKPHHAAGHCQQSRRQSHAGAREDRIQRRCSMRRLAAFSAVALEREIAAARGSRWTAGHPKVGEGGLELRSEGFSTVRSDPGNTDLTGAIQTTVLQHADGFYPVSTRPVEVPVEDSVEAAPAGAPRSCAASRASASKTP